MRLHNHIRILAATAAVAAMSCPAAYAVDIGEGGGGLPPASDQAIASSHHSGSTDWTLIALAGGGMVALVGAGAGSRRVSSRRGHARAGASHVA
jgi:hypothetical protein